MKREEITIFDKNNDKYTLEISHTDINIIIFRVYRNFGGNFEHAGEAKCFIDYVESKMTLADIVILDELNLLRTFKERIFALLGIYPKTYRRRGLGTILLKQVIEYARKLNLKYIHGSVVEDDIFENPNLLKWYEKNGFTITEPTSEELSHSVARIYMDLQN